MTAGIYTIKHKDNPEKFYIGSSKSCRQRFNEHRYAIKRDEKQYKLYKEIRQDGLDNYLFEIIEEQNIYDKFLLKEKEQDYITNLKPCLNTRNAYQTADEKKAALKEYAAAHNSIYIDCECGCRIKKAQRRRHERTEKHKSILIKQKLQELKDLAGENLSQYI